MATAKTKTKKTEAKPASIENPDTIDTFALSAGQRPVEVPAGTAAPQGPATIAVGGGSSAYYSTRPDVISDPTELAVGESVTVRETVWITSAETSNVTVSRNKAVAVDPRRAA